LALHDLEDAKRLGKLDIKVQPYDVWHFQSCHDLMGDEHPGRIPGELICHVLYFFTKPGSLVVDPMAGSGTTLDACLLMGRKARSYDIDLHHDRVDVETHNIAADGWPAATAKADLIFWDPPYFDKKDSEYVDGSISRLSRDEYLDFFAKRLGEAHEMVRPGARLAFLMSDWDDAAGGSGIFIWDYAAIIENAGWQLRRHIQVPLSTQQVHPDIVNKFRESRRLARLERYLLVAEA
jgi:DNA modification methylase